MMAEAPKGVQPCLRFANARALLDGLVRRTQIVLACARGEPNASIAKQMNLTPATVGKWRKRYHEHGFQGLHDELRPGRLRTQNDESLFAALNIATGKLLTQCKPRHRHQEFLAFLRHIDANVPQSFHIHYTLTDASWLN